MSDPSTRPALHHNSSILLTESVTTAGDVVV
jgi:hypothetical protein